MRSGTKQRLRLSGLGLSLAALALASTACAGTAGTSSDVNNDTESVAQESAISTSPAESRGATVGTAERTEQAEAFTACVRENGIIDFPGVTITADGQVRLNMSGSDVKVFSSEYKKAVAACSHLMPEGSSIPTDPAPPTPAAPDLGFVCGGNCPSTPKAPEPPS